MLKNFNEILHKQTNFIKRNARICITNFFKYKNFYDFKENYKQIKDFKKNT